MTPARVVVVGRDAALWLTANAVRRALASAGVTVAAIELPTMLHPASVHATLPPLEALHAKIGIDEAALLRATRGTFSFGHNIADRTGAMPAFFHAWGSYGAPIGGQPFFPHWLKARRYGLDAALQDFCPTAVAAKHGRMLLPDEETEAFGRTDYGYHLPAIAYVAYLKSRAPALGIVSHQALTIVAERDPTGDIAAVALDGGRRVEGDLFVDASGTAAVLAGSSGGAGDDWRGYFPVDRRLIARAPALAAIPPYADVRASSGGWTMLHPCRDGTRVVHAYASTLTSDPDALRAASDVSGLALAGAVVETVEPGRRGDAWQANCVAIGSAACTFDPVHGVDLQAVQLGIVHLLSLFPAYGAAQGDAERTEYNRIMRSHVDRLRDFQTAFYAASRFVGPLWNAGRACRVPDALTHKLAIFQARGDVAPMEDETFLADSWQALLVGLGMVPESWPPATDRTAPDRMKEEFRRILAFIRGKVLEQPAHDRYLDEIAGSKAA